MIERNRESMQSYTGVGASVCSSMGGFTFNGTTDFKYLGSLIKAKIKIESDISGRTLKIRRFYYALYAILRCKHVPRKLKNVSFKTILKFVVVDIKIGDGVFFFYIGPS